MKDQRPVSRWLCRALFTAVVSSTLAACSGAPGNVRLEAVEASGDGVLRVGLILDSRGDSAFLNASQLAAAKLAISEINEAGGHKGRAVELLPAQPERDTAEQARALVAAGADAVVGPTDSSHAAAAIDVLSREQIPLISPANTAAGLSRISSGGYYFRTMPADVAQGPILAKLAKGAGAGSVAVIHEETAYGEELSAAVAASAQQEGLEVTANVGFDADTAGAAAAEAAAANPGAAIVAARDSAAAALAGLAAAGLEGDRIILSDGAFGRYNSQLASGYLDGARAVVPGKLPDVEFQARLLAVDAGLVDLSFAAEAFDAVTAAALAAARAQDDAGRSIAANLIAVSGGDGGGTADNGGTAAPAGNRTTEACTSYKQCLAVLGSGNNADYDGESGLIAFDSNGDVTSATFTVYTYGADNNPELSGLETAGRAAQ